MLLSRPGPRKPGHSARLNSRSLTTGAAVVAAGAGAADSFVAGAFTTAGTGGAVAGAGAIGSGGAGFSVGVAAAVGAGVTGSLSTRAGGAGGTGRIPASSQEAILGIRRPSPVDIKDAVAADTADTDQSKRCAR